MSSIAVVAAHRASARSADAAGRRSCSDMVTSERRPAGSSADQRAEQARRPPARGARQPAVPRPAEEPGRTARGNRPLGGRGECRHSASSSATSANASGEVDGGAKPGWRAPSGTPRVRPRLCGTGRGPGGLRPHCGGPHQRRRRGHDRPPARPRGWTATSLRARGIALRAAGDLAAAEAALQESLEYTQHLLLFACWTHARFALVLISHDHLDAAVRHVRKALATGPPVEHYEARLARCELAAARAEPEAARLVAEARQLAAVGGHRQPGPTRRTARGGRRLTAAAAAGTRAGALSLDRRASRPGDDLRQRSRRWMLTSRAAGSQASASDRLPSLARSLRSVMVASAGAPSPSVAPESPTTSPSPGRGIGIRSEGAARRVVGLRVRPRRAVRSRGVLSRYSGALCPFVPWRRAGASGVITRVDD